MPRRGVPQPGGLTFVFTDIEGSTQLLRDLQSSYGLALRIHRRILRSCFEAHGGSEMGTEGDGLFFSFTTPPTALAAAVEAQQKIEHYSWPDGLMLRVRMGVHCGPATISDGEYVGLTIHEVARICAAAHGGQILCSEPIAKALGPSPSSGEFRNLGSYLLRGIPDARPLYQFCVADLEDDFPPPRDAVREGGVRVTIWQRATSAPPASSTGVPALALRTINGAVLDGDLAVEIRRASNGDGNAFRLIVRRRGVIEEEFDGLTMGGVSDAVAIVNAHSELIRIES
jgi:class 3 adenylate cyclase